MQTSFLRGVTCLVGYGPQIIRRKHCSPAGSYLTVLLCPPQIITTQSPSPLLTQTSFQHNVPSDNNQLPRPRTSSSENESTENLDYVVPFYFIVYQEWGHKERCCFYTCTFSLYGQRTGKKFLFNNKQAWMITNLIAHESHYFTMPRIYFKAKETSKSWYLVKTENTKGEISVITGKLIQSIRNQQRKLFRVHFLSYTIHNEASQLIDNWVTS